MPSDNPQTTPDTPWTALRWRVALWVVGLGIRLAPAGDAKERWGDYQRGWIREVREAWRLRYEG